VRVGVHMERRTRTDTSGRCSPQFSVPQEFQTKTDRGDRWFCAVKRNRNRARLARAQGCSLPGNTSASACSAEKDIASIEILRLFFR